MSPERLRAYVLVFIRDVIVPMAGVFLAVYLPVTGTFQPWQLPLIAGLCGVPLVARGDPPPKEGE